MIELGAVADDLTGATDLALMLTAAGYRTLVVVGGSRPVLSGVDAVVVALKSRTAPACEAVRDSLAATAWLRSHGARRLYVKYCSTFDSTAEGNIGPVVSAVLTQQDAPLTVVVPTFPATGRTVYQGHLFVGHRLLERSPMRDHPLTPMRDSDVVALLAAQTHDPVGLVPLEVVREGARAVRAALDAHQGDGVRLVVVDATQEADLAVIAQATSDLAVLTGGSALAAHLPAPARRRDTAAAASAPASTPGATEASGAAARTAGAAAPSATSGTGSTPSASPATGSTPSASPATGSTPSASPTTVTAPSPTPATAPSLAPAPSATPAVPPLTASPVPSEAARQHRPLRVVLSGSASAATRRQVQAALAAGQGLRLAADAVRTPADRGAFLDQAVQVAADAASAGQVLTVYTVAKAADLGDPSDADLLESVLGELSVRLVAAGASRMVIAGGETSGAVVAALGVAALRVFPALSPGVGWAHATRAAGSPVDLVLKSGNFGTDDLFLTAWDQAPETAR